jgi:hypothetical protein
VLSAAGISKENFSSETYLAGLKTNEIALVGFPKLLVQLNAQEIFISRKY